MPQPTQIYEIHTGQVLVGQAAGLRETLPPKGLDNCGIQVAGYKLTAGFDSVTEMDECVVRRLSVCGKIVSFFRQSVELGGSMYKLSFEKPEEARRALALNGALISKDLSKTSRRFLTITPLYHGLTSTVCLTDAQRKSFPWRSLGAKARAQQLMQEYGQKIDHGMHIASATPYIPWSEDVISLILAQSSQPRQQVTAKPLLDPNRHRQIQTTTESNKSRLPHSASFAKKGTLDDNFGLDAMRSPPQNAWTESSQQIERGGSSIPDSRSSYSLPLSTMKPLRGDYRPYESSKRYFMWNDGRSRATVEDALQKEMWESEQWQKDVDFDKLYGISYKADTWGLLRRLSLSTSPMTRSLYMWAHISNPDHPRGMRRILALTPKSVLDKLGVTPNMATTDFAADRISGQHEWSLKLTNARFNSDQGLGTPWKEWPLGYIPESPAVPHTSSAIPGVVSKVREGEMPQSQADKGVRSGLISARVEGGLLNEGVGVPGEHVDVDSSNEGRVEVEAIDVTTERTNISRKDAKKERQAARKREELERKALEVAEAKRLEDLERQKREAAELDRQEREAQGY